MSIEHAPGRGAHAGGWSEHPPPFNDPEFYADHDSHNTFKFWGFLGTLLAGFISFWFSELFFVDLSSRNGTVSLIEWVAIIPIGLMLTIGMIYCAYAVLYRVPSKPKRERARSLVAICAFWLLFGIVSQMSAQPAALSEAAEELQKQEVIETEIEGFREASRGVDAAQSAKPLLEADFGTADTLYTGEVEFGTVSGQAGYGRVASEILTVANIIDTTKSALVDYYAGVADDVRRGERVLDEIRRLQESMRLDENTRSERIDERVEELRRITDALVQSLPVESLIALQEALKRDWGRMGFEPRAVSKLDESFGPAASNYASIVSTLRDVRLNAEMLQTEPKEGLALIAAHADQLFAGIIAVLLLDLFGPLVCVLTLLLAPSRPAARLHPPLQPAPASSGPYPQPPLPPADATLSTPPASPNGHWNA